jgi:hypothetical protein
MNCEEVQYLLADYDEDLLNPVSGYPIQEHLKSCASCSKELAEIRLLFRVIAESDNEQPGDSLRQNFEKMLQGEIIKQGEGSDREKNKTGILAGMSWLKYAAGAAAAVAIFFLGGYTATKWRGGNDTASAPQIIELKKEVKDVKEMLMFDLLKEESASDRIKAVNYADNMPNPDRKVLDALIHTLNYDKNVNVRLASLYSLAKYTGTALVRDSLVGSLGKQTEPVIQVMLINLLTEKKEKKAIGPIQDIISNTNTLQEVKKIARQGLKSM